MLTLAVQSIRKMLSSPQTIDRVISANLVPRLVELLSLDESPMVQLEASWALTNIAAGESWQTRLVVESGAISPLIRLAACSSIDASIRMQSVWALGNIAADSLELRDQLLDAGVCKPLFDLARISSFESPAALLRLVAWTLRNLCLHKLAPALPPQVLLEDVLPAFTNLLASNDRDVLVYACSTLAYLTEPNKLDSVDLIAKQLVPRLCDLLSSHYHAASSPCHDADESLSASSLRCIANILAGSSSQSVTPQLVIDSNVLPVFRSLLVVSSSSSARCEMLKRNVVKALASIIAGGREQIQAVITAELVPILVKLMNISSTTTLKHEALWAVIYYTFRASDEQVLYLFRCDVVESICELLVRTISGDVELLQVVLVALMNILMVAQMAGQLECVRALIVEFGGLDKIEQLQLDYSTNESVLDLSTRIVDKFFRDYNDDHKDIEILCLKNNQDEKMDVSTYDSNASEVTICV